MVERKSRRAADVVAPNVQTRRDLRPTGRPPPLRSPEELRCSNSQGNVDAG